MTFLDGSTFRLVAIVLGLLALALVAFVIALPWVVQPFLKLALWPRYHLKRIGLENLPRTGPVLLVSNHMSWFDGFFLAASLPRRGTALVNTGVFSWPILGYCARRCGLIPIPFSGPKGQRGAIDTARKALDDGNLLGIFPEGQLSRNGLTGPFHRGLEVILKGKETVPVVPVYLDNVWGSLLSYSDGVCLNKWPKGWRRTVVVSFGPPVELPVTAFKSRQAVLSAGVAARAALGHAPRLPETVDHALPHYDHPTLGPLTGSAADVSVPFVQQIGQKPGTVGLPLPGIAIQAVDDSGKVLPADVEGQLQALVPGRAGWEKLDRRGKVDRDGFVILVE